MSTFYIFTRNPVFVSLKREFGTKTKTVCIVCIVLFTTVQVSPNSHAVTLVGSDTIAGSCCTMLEILHNLVHVLDVPVGQAVAMLSENPARSVCNPVM